MKATRLAIEYQRRYRKDVFVDLVCYRRHGHNELDDPTFTNPLLYQKIHATGTLPDSYAEKLIAEGVLSKADVESAIKEHNDHCMEHYEKIDSYEPKTEVRKAHWSGMEQPPSAVSKWDTGTDLQVLKYVGMQAVEVPEGFVSIVEHLQMEQHETKVDFAL